MRPTIGVLIPTYCRRSHLREVLHGLFRQTIKADEVIVLDASPKEENLSAEEVAAFGDDLQYQPGCERGNISRQRNDAVRRSKADILLFLDDDVEFTDTLIEDYLGAFANTQADGITGLILLPGEQVLNLPKTKKGSVLLWPGAPNYQATAGVVESYVICTASFAIKRHSLYSVGGFDEQVHGTFDDLDCGVRLWRAGSRLLHHDRPRLTHLRAPCSGSRAPGFGLEWTYANLFYFQLRHFWGKRPQGLLLLALWQYCRPSRTWLAPREVLHRAGSIRAGFIEAMRRLDQGPILPLKESGS
jgi:GT2 family glycosyltransferase